MRSLILILAITWTQLWLTPDQQGQRHYRRKEYSEAAAAFRDPLWRGVSWYRAGEFEKAAGEFARRSTPEARYNEGNTWLMMGKYDQAVERYDQALELRPDWQDAKDNRELAVARGEMLAREGGDMGDQKLGADEIVFDQKKPPGGQDTVVASEHATSDEAVQALWLRRVQTKPADFLKSKFAFQQARRSQGADK